MIQETATVQAWLIERTWLRREVKLTGGVRVTIAYDARLVGIGVRTREIIRVNGAEVETEQWGDLFEKHSHSFCLSLDGRRIPLLIEVEFAPISLLEIWKFGVVVEDVPVYEERWGRASQSGRVPQLPIPSERPRAARPLLPVVSDREGPHATSLPIPGLPEGAGG